MSNFSVSCWVKCKSGVAFQGIVSAQTNSPSWNGWVLGCVTSGTSKFTFSPRSGGSAVYLNSATATTTDWNHVVGVRDGTSIKLYVNGVETSDTFSSIGDPGSVTTRLGQWYTGDDYPLYGDLDEVAIWDGALSASDVSALYNSGSGIASNDSSLSISSSLLAYYNMEQDVGTATLTDRSGNGHNGTLTNMNIG